MLDKVFPFSIATEDASKIQESFIDTKGEMGFWRVGDPSLCVDLLMLVQYLFCQHLLPGLQK